jgi:hypothetical protein
MEAWKAYEPYKPYEPNETQGGRVRPWHFRPVTCLSLSCICLLPRDDRVQDGDTTARPRLASSSSSSSGRRQQRRRTGLRLSLITDPARRAALAVGQVWAGFDMMGRGMEHGTWSTVFPSPRPMSSWQPRCPCTYIEYSTCAV